MPPHRLSKSRISSGLQCPKRLWLETYHPEFAEESDGAKTRMSIGATVGELAWDILPGGQLVGLEDGFEAAIDTTAELLAQADCPPIYEATFSHNGVLIRADLLEKTGGGVRLLEVKSATSVKPYHLFDCAIQQWVVERAGWPVRSVELAHINTDFVYPGNRDYNGLFHLENVSKEAGLLLPKVPQWISTFTQVLEGDMPYNEVGSHCRDPFPCPFEVFCTPDDAAEYPLSCLPRARAALVEDLRSEGILDVRDIPEERLTNSTHDRVRRVTLKGEPETSSEFGPFLATFAYPRYYLDFETIQFAVPIWAGTRPYQQLPFQWSCHVEEAEGELGHLEFLDLSGQPPMRLFAESLLDACGKTGPIFVYSHFEKTVITALAKKYPALAVPLHAIIGRLVDLLPLTREYYYHPAMKGSWSIKAVLPCVAPDLDYGQLEEVKDGTAAQNAYLEAIDPATTRARKEYLCTQMLAYCHLDTLALVRLVEFFQRDC